MIYCVFFTEETLRKTIIHLKMKPKGCFPAGYWEVWSNLSVGEAGMRPAPLWTQQLSAWVTFWAASSHYWQRKATVFEMLLTQLVDFCGHTVLLVTFGERTWKNHHLEYENWIHIFMFQMFSAGFQMFSATLRHLRQLWDKTKEFHWGKWWKKCKNRLLKG